MLWCPDPTCRARWYKGENGYCICGNYLVAAPLKMFEHVPRDVPMYVLMYVKDHKPPQWVLQEYGSGVSRRAKGKGDARFIYT